MEAHTEFPKLKSPPETAAMLRINENTLRRWRMDGKGPQWLKVGGRYFYTDQALREFMKVGPA